MYKLLLVDDEASIRQLLRMTLEMDGFEVIEATDGLEALKVYEKELPDVVLLDVKLPLMNGIEVLERLRKINPDAEVIMISGHGDMEMAIDCLRREASNFLLKPVSDELLSLSIKRSLEKLNLKKRLRQYTYNLETLVREANIELERAYAFRENIIENCPDALICIRKGGEIILFNSAAEKLLGYSKKDVVGKMNIVDLYPPGLARIIMKNLRSNDYGGKGLLQKTEMSIVHRSGLQIPVYISAALLYEGGQETGSVGIFTDLTEKKKMENQLMRSRKLSSLGKLASGVAHEMNEPLSGILSRAGNLLRKYEADTETCSDLTAILRETNRLQGIVHNILDFSRETPPSMSNVVIQEILRRALEIVKLQARFDAIRLKAEFQTDLPTVWADANQIQRVFVNILMNAAEAINGPGALTIRIRSAGRFVEIDFEDSGPGISEDTLESIFDPFFTTKQSSQGSGVGMGLAVSYGIVKNHGGDILVTSQLNKGSTFTVRLPKATCQAS